ncbi:predicted protein [Lichtheimia corymbifera JMRC:FSU:9682]|uniref:Uncharacterized protein n=1 Tax=Lichtheimia corymbifera JMRC:FSU:9682 TaxID=1263082 RepID=A0A068S0E8_9FUNG|nr:predicted protein [Lichtheimia corymbifera JMRC:FSU:9682]
MNVPYKWIMPTTTNEQQHPYLCATKHTGTGDFVLRSTHLSSEAYDVMLSLDDAVSPSSTTQCKQSSPGRAAMGTPLHQEIDQQPEGKKAYQQRSQGFLLINILASQRL